MVKLQESDLIPLIEKYLASIPEANDLPVMRPDQITALPHHFPQGVIIEDVRCLHAVSTTHAPLKQ